MDLDMVTVFVASTAVILVLGLSVVMFVLYYQKRLIGQKMKVQALESDRQSELMGAMIEAQERERIRLSKDLHDDVGALLTATKLQVNQLELKINEPKEAVTFLNLTKKMLEESVASVRRVSYDLVPATLERFGLTDALTAFSERFNATGDLEVSLTSDLGELRFSEKVEMGVFRIAQELVNNTAKHAKAKRAAIALSFLNQSLQLSYHDNGTGFDPKAIVPGLGLKNLETRVNLLNGDLQITTALNQGFSARVIIPELIPLPLKPTT